MKLDIIDKTIIFEGGGLVSCLNDEEPLYLKGGLKDKIIEDLVSKYKEEAARVNEENNVIEIYLKSSNKCNLKCSYCFRKVQNIEFNVEYIKTFIKSVIKKYNCEKVKIDLTGDSEPLMEIGKLQEIIDLCNVISAEENVEFVYSLNSNGTCMSEEILNFLYSNSILFGFTVEGFSLNNYKRIYGDGNIAQNDVIANIRKYKLNENDLFGTSMTLTSDHTDLVKEYTNLLELCSAISMRIVNVFDETGVVKENLKDWKKRYKDLALYLLEQLKDKRYERVSPILRSRDFFGTFIKAILFNVKRNQACLGGYKQLFLNYTGEVYICSWGYSDNKYNIGNYIDLIDERVDHFKNYTVDTDKLCKECDVRYICGGECHIIRGENDDFSAWCELKTYLIGLAYYLIDWLKNNDLDGLRVLQKSVTTNNYFGQIEPYIKVIKKIFDLKNISKGPNQIKNEVECITNGPEIGSVISYLRKNNIELELIEDEDGLSEEYIYILHKLIGKYNYYELIENINNLQEQENIKSIVRVKI